MADTAQGARDQGPLQRTDGNGDHRWFTEDVSVHLDAVYRYFARRAPAADVDDLTSDVFEVAWRRRSDVPREFVLPWLYRTASLTLSNFRRRVGATPLHLTREPSVPDHSDRIAARDELTRAMALLAPRDREILLLNAWEGLDGAELGAALGISRSGAQAALSRARARLRALYTKGHHHG